MKKLVSLSLVLLMAFSVLTGCSTNEEDTGGDTEGTKYVIANTPKCVGIAWWDRMEVGNQIFSKATGHEVYQSGGDASADASEQLKYIEDAIAEGVDIITVIPNDPDACETTLKKARDNGIVVISHEAEGMTNVDYDIEAFVNEEYGAHLMDLLAAEMGEEGEYCIMVGAFTMTSHAQWAEGAEKRQAEAYPNMVNIGRVESAAAGGGSEGSKKVAKEVIAAHPNVKGFIGCDMVDPPGIAAAVEEAGKAGEIAVTGTCLTSVCQSYLENGTMKTFSAWDPSTAGQAMCALGVLVKEGVEITDGIDLGVEGFHNCTVKGNIVYGQAWFDGTVDNYKDYDF